MAAGDAGRRDAPGRGRGPGGWFGRWSGGRAAQGQRLWRVGGAEESGDPGRAGRDGPGGGSGLSRFWWLFVVLLAVNWIIASVMLSPEPRATVSYTFFLDQVGAANVESVTSTGETIEGTFKNPVSYAPLPPDGGPEQVSRFTTQRPSFATDDLFGQLRSTGVPVNANPPDAGAPWWQQLLLGFGPTLLLVWLLFAFAKRAGGGGGVLGSFGRSRAMLYRPEAGPRTNVRRCGRHR
jgi:cell division protease FtsH